MNEGLTAYISAFVDELVRSNVEDLVVSPGSRSTPIAVLAAEHPRMRVHVIIDERSAGYFALGLAKAKRQAVGLLCTSGTAAANFLPAVAEAYLARVPLVVLTADRPHELREVGAPQTMRQIGLYGGHVKWFFDMPLPEAGDQMIRHARMTASRAAATAVSAPQGPVHLNFPLREPLLPNLHSPSLWGGGREGGAAYTTVSVRSGMLEADAAGRLAEELKSCERGLIVCGPLDMPGFAEAVTELAETLQFPVLADPLSQVRNGSHSKTAVIDSYDSFLRDGNTAERLKPEVILRFGAMPVSKSLLQYIQRHSEARILVVDEGEGWRDPALQASAMISADPAAFCRSLQERLSLGADGTRQRSAWMEAWLDLQRITREVLEGAEAYGELFEGRIFTELQAELPERAILYVGNSMPIRDLDTFFACSGQRVRIMGNRGANGIDGLVSSALGASCSGQPVVLVIGDLSFYHDMNGLLAAKTYGLDVTVVLVNNDGGGIFSFLSQADLPNQRFEQLFGTPTGLNFEKAAELYGAVYTRIASWEKFREALRRSFAEGGLHVIEVPTDRPSNVVMHRELHRKLFERLASLR